MATTHWHRSISQRALLVFLLVLVLLVGAIGLAVSSLQGKYLRDEARAQFQTELVLLGGLAVEPLLRNDYDAVERLVNTWVGRRDFPLHITAIMPNGFVLASAQNSQTINHALIFDQPVVFNGRKQLTLHATADLSAREEDISIIMRNAAIIAAALVILLGWVLWSVLQRTAIRPLEAEIESRLQKELELKQRTAELETANKELDSFSYSVSHDLRAPLRAIDGYCLIISQDYAQVLDASAQHYLARSRAAAQRMGQLIDDLLNLARTTQHELSMANVDLSALSREILDRLAQADPRRKVSITIKDGMTADSDPSMMESVLDNLLSNAWKYTSLTPDVAIEVGSEEQDGQPVFFVRDNGAGFDMHYGHKLFHPFQRLHGSEYPGNGIGLAIVQRIIQRHGGRIWAVSKPGKGATFYFTLGH